MWICTGCGVRHSDNFDACWKCGKDRSAGSSSGEDGNTRPRGTRKRSGSGAAKGSQKRKHSGSRDTGKRKRKESEQDQSRERAFHDQGDEEKSEAKGESFPKDEKCYAEVLGLRGRVSRDDIRQRYLELMRQYHPDKVNHLGPKLREVAERETKAINQAYEFFRSKYGMP